MRVEKRYIGQRAHSAIQYQKPSSNTYYSCPFGHRGNVTPLPLGGRVAELLLFCLLSAKLPGSFKRSGASPWATFHQGLFHQGLVHQGLVHQRSPTDVVEFMASAEENPTFPLLTCCCSRMAGKYSTRLQPDPNTHSSGTGTTLPTALKTCAHA